MAQKHCSLSSFPACSLGTFTAPHYRRRHPLWRGPLGTGVCEEKNLPVQWSATNNVKWRAVARARELDAGGLGERVFVTQPVGERRTLMCFQRADGKSALAVRRGHDAEK